MKLPRITIVVTEAGHPLLYSRLKAENAPLARAALLKRLAEDGARMEGSSQYSPCELSPTKVPQTSLAKRPGVSNADLLDPDLTVWFKSDCLG